MHQTQNNVDCVRSYAHAEYHSILFPLHESYFVLNRAVYDRLLGQNFPVSLNRTDIYFLITALQPLLARLILFWKTTLFRFLPLFDHLCNSPGGKEYSGYAISIEAG